MLKYGSLIFENPSFLKTEGSQNPSFFARVIIYYEKRRGLRENGGK
jgi:cation transport regulator ChaC